MKFKWSLIAVVVASLASFQARAGNEGAHGGAGVRCTASSLNKFNGFYMLDFIVMRGGPGTNVYPYPAEYQDMTDYDQILDWIHQNIAQKLPGIANGLQNFRRTAFVNNPAAFRNWVPVAQLPRIYDQGLGNRPWAAQYEINFVSRDLPPNCRYVDIEQVAAKWVRWDNSEAYLYIPRLVNQLQASGPLQVSYLVMHEYLRAYTNNAEAIRRSNRLLHSTAVQQLSQQQLRQLLYNFGLFFP